MTPRPPQPVRLRRRDRQGFTLIEVMLALGVLIIGVTAVLALVPSAILIQRESVDAVLAQFVAENGESMLKGRGLIHKDETDTLGMYYQVTPVDLQVHAFPSSILSDWPVEDRTYPSTTADINNRSWGWIPMIRRVNDVATNEKEWLVYILVVKKAEGVNTLPALVSITVSVSGADEFVAASPGNKLRIGDPVIDNFGNIYRVNFVDDTIPAETKIRVGGLISPSEKTTGSGSVMPDKLYYTASLDANTSSLRIIRPFKMTLLDLSQPPTP